jgi:hypothetical protein
MSNLTNNQIWGNDLPNIHKHTCRKCGQVNDCGGDHCPEKEEEYLCYECLISQMGGIHVHPTS